ncbi:MAG: class I SAM-dependent methyltransferase [Bacillota bacterium]
MTDYETLRQAIAGEIRERGPMTFQRYMELCLYHPAWGYYNRPGPIIGRAGDFYTSPQVGAVFGRTLARQVEEVWELSGRPEEFWVVEYGAGTGVMAADVIGGLLAGELGRRLRYLIIETSPARREEQAKAIGPPVVWAPDLGPVNGAAACVLANELVDAFPVHVVRGGSGDGAGLQELHVTTVSTEGDGPLAESCSTDIELISAVDDHRTTFGFIPGAPSTPALAAYLDWLGVHLVDGQTAEVNLDALRWLERLDHGLTRGAAIVIDYGYLTPSLYNPEFRFDGTVMTYRRHRASPDPFAAPGEQDLTAHVNFSALMKRGGELGWGVAGYSDQLHFLVNLGILDAAAGPDLGAVKHLVMPGAMGERFKVLALCKGLGQSGEPPRLKGFHGVLPGKAD